MAEPKYTDEQKARAVNLVRQGMTHREAAEHSGIPLNYLRTMIQRKRSKLKDGHVKAAELNSFVSTPIGGVAAGAAYELVGEEIAAIMREKGPEIEALLREAVTSRAQEIQGKLFEVIIAASDNAIKMLRTGPSTKETKSAWLKAVLAVLAQAVEKHELVAGKPTERHEQQGQVTERYEYDVTHRVEQYADVYRRLAQDRRVLPSIDESDNSGEPMDSD